MQIPKSEFMQFIELIDPDFLGVVLLLSSILFFVTLIVTIVSLTRMIQNMMVVRTNHRMIEHLLAQGMSADDIERLVFGKKRWPSLAKFMRRANLRHPNTTPVAPIKPTVSAR